MISQLKNLMKAGLSGDAEKVRAYMDLIIKNYPPLPGYEGAKIMLPNTSHELCHNIMMAVHDVLEGRYSDDTIVLDENEMMGNKVRLVLKHSLNRYPPDPMERLIIDRGNMFEDIKDVIRDHEDEEDIKIRGVNQLTRKIIRKIGYEDTDSGSDQESSD